MLWLDLIYLLLGVNNALFRHVTINALIWLMTLALLIFSATEYLMRKKMAENKLLIPSPDLRTELTRPSMMRVYQYLSNSSICLTYIPGSEFVKLTGVPKNMQKILLSKGRNGADIM